MIPCPPALVLGSLPLDPGASLAAARQARILAEMRRRCAGRGLLVMLDATDDGPYRAALVRAGQDPRFVGWMDMVAFCEPRWDTGEMAALAQREGWPLRPGWALLDRDAQVIARGSRPPGVEDLWQALQDLGVPSMEAVLDRFLGENPERADAWQARFDLAYRRAILSMAEHLGPGTDDRPSLRADMDPALDRRIWEACARSLAKVVQGNGWLTAYGEPMGRFIVAGRYYALSPTMRDAIRPLKPALMETLERYPTAVDLWSFFLTLDAAEPIPSLSAFLDTLRPGPDGLDWPPRGPAFRLQEEAEERKDLPTLAAERRNHLDRALATPVESWGALQLEKHRRIVWLGALLPYLEVLLEMGQDARAEEAIARTLAWSQGKDEGYLRMAADLADRFGRTYAAAHFQRVRPAAAPPAPQAGRADARSRLEALETFHKDHPNQREVSAALLRERLVAAGRRTPPGPGPLEAHQDADLWGPSARLLADHYLDPANRLAPLALEFPEGARRSPLLRAAAVRARDLLEAQITMDPRWPQDWKNWIALNRLAEPARGIRSLVDRCPPLPNRPLSLPLPALLECLADARTRGEWSRVVELVDPLWETFVRTWIPPFPQPPASSPETGQRLREAQALLGALVEAQLRLKRFAEADYVVRVMLGVLPHRDLAGTFGSHALAMNRPDLARAWGSLVPVGR